MSPPVPSPRSRASHYALGTAAGAFLLVILIGACAGTSRTDFGRDSAVIKKAESYGLVHVPAKLPSVKIDLRYRTSENATGRPMYPANMPCLLHPKTVEMLSKAQSILQRKGYSIVILDAWRPPESHQALWNAVQDPTWVVPPSDGLSMHCYGLAVDVGLEDLHGNRLKMPSRFDEFSLRAKRDYTGPDPEIRKNLAVLQDAMERAGFRSIPDEWWHFDVPGRNHARRVSAATLGIDLPQ